MPEIIHVYYQRQGSEHWWCRCFQEGAWHGCLTRQEEDVVRRYSFAAGRQCPNSSAREQLHRYVSTLTYPRLLAEIRMLLTTKPCLHFEQWVEPPAEAVLYWKAADVEPFPAYPVRRYCACGRVLELQDLGSTCSTCGQDPTDEC